MAVAACSIFGVASLRQLYAEDVPRGRKSYGTQSPNRIRATWRHRKVFWPSRFVSDGIWWKSPRLYSFGCSDGVRRAKISGSAAVVVGSRRARWSIVLNLLPFGFDLRLVDTRNENIHEMAAIRIQRAWTSYLVKTLQEEDVGWEGASQIFRPRSKKIGIRPMRV